LLATVPRHFPVLAVMGADSAAAPPPAVATPADATAGASATVSGQDKAAKSSRVTSTKAVKTSQPSTQSKKIDRVPDKTPGKAGLTDEQITQIAQTKFEVQEDRLRDVMRLAMSTVRDLPKLAEADRTRRVTEVQKALLKYEMQIRGWEYQERRRKVEISRLEAEAVRYRKDADAECARTDELSQGLEREWKRRRFYEAHERAAIEVTQIQSTEDAVAAIAKVKEEIASLKKQRTEYDALIEERSQRAQLLQQAVQELAQDVRKEKEHASQALSAHPAAAGSVVPEMTTLIC